MHWEAIEPVAETFGDLDPRTDAREADLAEGDEWAGWHLIEKDLWPAAAEVDYEPLSDAERTEYADRLLTDLSTLKGEVADADYTGEQIANGAKELLDEVANGKVTGEEEFWSHTDLYDFQANVDGARKSFDVLTPVVDETDPELAKTLTTRFSELQTLLDQHRVRRRVRLLHRPDRRRGQGALRRRQRAVRTAGEPGRGGRSAVTRRLTVSRRGLLGVGAGTALGAAAGAGGVALVARDDGAGPVVPFHGEHQAGIVTPAQDRLHFAAFDVTTEDRAELVSLLERWTAAAVALTAGRPVGDGEPTPHNAPPRDTGEAGGLAAVAAHVDLRLRARAVPGRRRPGPVRARGPPPGGARTTPALPSRPARPGAQRRRPVRAGLRRRPPGRRARDPQPFAARLRDRGDPLVPARLRPHVVDQSGAGHAAQPVRLQGRHREPQVRGRRRSVSARVGRRPATTPAPVGWPAAATSSPGGSA